MNVSNEFPMGFTLYTGLKGAKASAYVKSKDVILPTMNLDATSMPRRYLDTPTSDSKIKSGVCEQI